MHTHTRTIKIQIFLKEWMYQLNKVQILQNYPLILYNILNVEQSIYSRVKETKLREFSTLSKSSKRFLVSKCMTFLFVCIHINFTECFVYSCSTDCEKCFRWWKAIIHSLVLQSFFWVGSSGLQFDLKFYQSNFHWHFFTASVWK